MKRALAGVLAVAAMSIAAPVAIAEADQPQAGQPGLTEGQNGPPPSPGGGGGGGGQPQSGQPGLTEGQNGPPPYP
jgi:hypothetical protein